MNKSFRTLKSISHASIYRYTFDMAIAILSDF